MLEFIASNFVTLNKKDNLKGIIPGTIISH